MQNIRIIKIPKFKMVSSGIGMFGEENLETFSEQFSNSPGTIYPKDFLYWDETGFCWLYLYDESLSPPDKFEIVDFEGGLYSVATDIEDMKKEIDEFLCKNGFERDKSRYELGNIITSPLARKTLGHEQMDYYFPIKEKKLRITDIHQPIS